MDEIQENIFKDESIDIKKYLFKILFNWYWFAISIFFTVSIAYLVNRYTEPIFRVSSSPLAPVRAAKTTTSALIIMQKNPDPPFHE